MKHRRALDTKGRNALFDREKDRKDWLVPWVVSLVLHAGAILFLLPRFLTPPATVHRPEAIRVMLTPPEEAPSSFVELPPNRADAAPVKADFLSNVTSRARDRVPGGGDDLPRMEGRGDAPAVGSAPGGSPSRSPATPLPQSTEPVGAQAADSRPTAQAPDGRAPARLPDDAALRGSAGTSALDQPEMAHPGGNAGLTGEVSLNTTAWDYAPWLQRFGMQLRERWYPPPAYSMGILKDGGWALFDVEISRSGQLLRLELLDQQGHPSLIHSAQSALRSMAPIERLPADFPEPTLILRIRMIYPSR